MLGCPCPAIHAHSSHRRVVFRLFLLSLYRHLYLHSGRGTTFIHISPNGSQIEAPPRSFLINIFSFHASHSQLYNPTSGNHLKKNFLIKISLGKKSGYAVVSYFSQSSNDNSLYGSTFHRLWTRNRERQRT